MLRKLLRAVALGAAIAGLVYVGAARRYMREFERRSHEDGAYEPDVTILKPLCGDEPELCENLRSFCDQRYGNFRIVFGVANESDPARAVAEQIRKAFPSRDIVISVGADRSATNPKIGNLAVMATHARGEIVIIADSDMRVDATYLRSIVAPFEDARVGAVTCLYRAKPQRDLWSTLGAAYINAYFAPSVLVATRLEPLAFALGATIAVRNVVLETVGGFKALGAQLADDYELGRLTRAAGYEVYLSRYVVENRVAESSLSSLMHHELRWARTIFAVRPLGYAFSGVTFPLMWALVYRLLGGRKQRARLLWLIAFALRAGLQKAAYEALGAQRLDPLWLIPLREALSFGIWLASFFGTGVMWRDQRFQQDKHGALNPAER
ncbi:MAG: bacteriohopanetetrol glucosamine biosynthesis glycosyltransferase HpnI [Candidatus Eremiobacteraeota bacterium]|nr:bacteriohopanetetrol glucosamine biosynthesis glycosyltransferase HpnI [Candidatus Eremiobacteraeota bacterium]